MPRRDLTFTPTMSAPMEVEGAAAAAPAADDAPPEIYEHDDDAVYEGVKVSIDYTQSEDASKHAKASVTLELSKQFAQQCSVTSRLIEDMGEGAEFAIPLPPDKCDADQVAQIEQCLLGSHYVAKEIDVDKKDPKTGAPVKNDKGDVVKIKRVVRGDLVLPNAEKALEGLDFNQVCNLSIAVDYLEHEHLLDPVAKKIATFIKGKDPAEIKKMCGIEREFTKEEIEQVYVDHPWLKPKNADAPK